MSKKEQQSDFCIIDTPKKSRLSKLERLTLLGGEELDKALLGLSQQFSSLSSVSQLGDPDLEALKRAAKFYSKPEWRKTPALFFSEPSSLPQVREVAIHGLADGLIVDLSFKSAYQVHDAEFQAEYLASAENQNVHARMWRHNKQSLGCVVAVHGWSMGDQRVNSLAFLPGAIYQLGLDVVMLELPYHGRRKSEDAQHPLFPSVHMVRTNEAIGQAISDLRELTLYLRSQGQQRIGCVGMSLGAYVGALWSSIDQLDFCVPIVPLCNMSEMAWDILSRDSRFQAWQEQGLSPELLQQIYYLHSPLSFKALTAKERIFIVAGIGDEVVPPRQPKLLWDHWKRPKMSWFGGGHAAQIKRREAFDQVMEFVLKAVEISK